VGIHIDRSGNDTYASRRDGGLNVGRPARDSASIGVLVDLSGTDSYLASDGQADSSMWSNSRYGVGWDIAPPPEAEATASTSGPNQPPGADVKLPDIIAYEGELTQEVFDELWEIAIRWEVGENVAIVPRARERIVAFGMPVLPFVVNEMVDDYSLAVRAFNEIYPQLMELDRTTVLAAIRTASVSDVYTQRNCVLRVIGDLKITELSDVVIGYFDDPRLRRRAIAVIGMIGSHAADVELLAMLSDPATDEKVLQAAIGSAASLELDCTWELLALLGHEHVTVRDSVVGRLSANWPVYSGRLLPELARQCRMRSGVSKFDRAGSLSVTQLRSLLAVLHFLDAEPDATTVESVGLLLDDLDWGMRADAFGLLHKWQQLESPASAAAIADMSSLGDALIITEKHPYVLGVWQEGQ